MAQRIIYPNGSGGIAVVTPSEKGGLPISEIARKDVPAGLPFRLVDEADIPTDRSQRDLWTADFSQPDGYGIGAEAWFAEQAAAERAAAEGDAE